MVSSSVHFGRSCFSCHASHRHCRQRAGTTDGLPSVPVLCPSPASKDRCVTLTAQSSVVLTQIGIRFSFSFLRLFRTPQDADTLRGSQGPALGLSVTCHLCDLPSGPPPSEGAGGPCVRLAAGCPPGALKAHVPHCRPGQEASWLATPRLV